MQVHPGAMLIERPRLPIRRRARRTGAPANTSQLTRVTKIAPGCNSRDATASELSLTTRLVRGLGSFDYLASRNRLNRRQFLRSSALAVGATALAGPALLRGRSLNES